MEERLHAAAPGDAANHRQLGLSHFYVGDLLAALGEVSAARAHYVQALAIGETLAARDPSNRTWQQNLARYQAGLALATPDQPARRRQLLDGAARIVRGLTAADPTNTVWTRVLAETLSERGGALADTGDLAAAAADADAAVQAMESVRGSTSGDLQMARARSLAHALAGRVCRLGSRAGRDRAGRPTQQRLPVS